VLSHLVSQLTSQPCSRQISHPHNLQYTQRHNHHLAPLHNRQVYPAANQVLNRLLNHQDSLLHNQRLNRVLNPPHSHQVVLHRCPLSIVSNVRWVLTTSQQAILVLCVLRIVTGHLKAPLHANAMMVTVKQGLQIHSSAQCVQLDIMPSQEIRSALSVQQVVNQQMPSHLVNCVHAAITPIQVLQIVRLVVRVVLQ
jgi:hypothetical protein